MDNIFNLFGCLGPNNELLWGKLLFTKVPYLFLIGWFIFSFMYIWKYINYLKKSSDEQKNNQNKWLYTHLLDSIPSVFTMLGVLGTFLGIVYGLWNFDVDNINENISQLLDGLKSAFITSIAGITLSIVFSKPVEFVHKMIDDQEEQKEKDKIDEEKIFREELLERISISLDKNFSKAIKKFIKKMDASNEEIKKQLINKFGNFLDKNLDTLKKSIDQLNIWQQENKVQVQTLIEQFEKVVEQFETASGSIESIATSTEKLVGYDSQLQKLIIELQSVMVENTMFKESVKELNLSTGELSKSIVVIKDVAKLLNEWVEREKTFVETRDKLITKVEGNVKNIGEFNEESQKQVKVLLEEFKTISQDMAIASESISEITNSTKKLTNDSSALQKIVNELEGIIVKDSKFGKSVEKLGGIADIITKNSENVNKNSRLLSSLIDMENRLITSSNDLLSKYTATFNVIDNLIKKLNSVPNNLERAAIHTKEIAESVEILSNSRSTLKKLVGQEVENRREIIKEYGQIINRTAQQLKNWFAQEQEFVRFMQGLLKDLQKNEWIKREATFSIKIGQLIEQISKTESYRKQTFKSWDDINGEAQNLTKSFKNANNGVVAKIDEQNTRLLKSGGQLTSSLEEIGKKLSATLIELNEQLRKTQNHRPPRKNKKSNN